jgi:aminoglycoside/choline kinase family phosphotransferase
MLVAGEVYLIDFQGMRLGCAAYDLGALLYDSYQESVIRPAVRAAVWQRYRDAVAGLGGTPPADELLPTAALQRLLQCLGAYGKLWLKDGLEWYRQFICPGLRLMIRAAEDAGSYPGMAELARESLRLVTSGKGL